MNEFWNCQSMIDAVRRQQLSRRNLLSGLGLLCVGSGAAQAQVSINAKSKDGNTLVVVFLRGGADGLNLVAPYADDLYQKARPSLALKGKSGTKEDRAIDLDGYFGLHPKFAPLEGAYKEGKMAIVHAVGSQDQTRSHFEAMATMERGLSDLKTGSGSGWLGRFLMASARSDDSPLRAVALSSIMPDSLRGGTHTIAIENLTDFRLGGDEGFARQLKQMYAKETDEVRKAGLQTLSVLDTIKNLDAGSPSAAIYPNVDIGQSLKQVAMLIKANVGVEIACVDKGGWDTHVIQGAGNGNQGALIDDLAKSLAAFTTDLGEQMSRTTVLVMTEFGRRSYENSGLGTDHGRGSVMFLLGADVLGGKVYAKWPGLKESDLEPPGDLRVTTDYRQILGEVLAKRHGANDLGTIFPGMTSEAVGILA